MLLFLKVFFTEFIAEMGDKTQLMLIALTSKYKLKDIIMGTAAAILVLNGLAVLAGGLVSEFIPEWLIKIVAAFAFLYFAASTLAGDEDEEEEEGGKSKTPDGLLNTLAFVIFAIFGIYTAYQALNLISESVCPITVWPLLAAVTVAFVVICVWLYMKKKKGQDVSVDKG